MAQMLDAYRHYFRAIKESYIRGDAQVSAELDRARAAVRLARSNLEASIESIERGAGHFRGEPEVAQWNTGQLAPAGARHDGARGRVTEQPSRAGARAVPPFCR